MIRPSPKQIAYGIWIDIGKVAKPRAHRQGRIKWSTRVRTWMGNKVEPGYPEERFKDVRGPMDSLAGRPPQADLLKRAAGATGGGLP